MFSIAQLDAMREYLAKVDPEFKRDATWVALIAAIDQAHAMLEPNPVYAGLGVAQWAILHSLPGSVHDICVKTRLQPPRIYKILHSLRERNLVRKVGRGKYERT